MTRVLITTVILLLAACVTIDGSAQEPDQPIMLDWSELPELPPAQGQQKQSGLAGPFCGVHNGVLIVAGGSNFPSAPPWEGGKKVWWDDVFVLERSADGKYRWITDKAFRLLQPSAYGVSITTSDGTVCIGGCDSEKCHNSVFMIRWDPKTRNVTISQMPSLPRPLAFMAGAIVNNTIYIAGGQEDMKGALATKNFFALDLSKKSDPNNFRWKELDPWPGPARITNLAAAQSDGTNECFYMFSGRNPLPGKPTDILTDAYKYSPRTGSWSRVSDITIEGISRCVMAGTTANIGNNKILVFGGDADELFLKLEKLNTAMNQVKDEKAAHSKKEEYVDILVKHPGFSDDILSYDTVKDKWSKVGKLPTTSHVTTSAVKWDGSIVIPSGEFSPGVRTPRVWKANPAPLLPRKPSASNNMGAADGGGTNQANTDETSNTNKVISWSQLPDLPYPAGLAGPFVGVHQNALIIAGGTSFQKRAGKVERVWHNDVRVLIKDQNGSYKWIDGFKLDKPIAYGASVSTDRGVVCIGGSDSNRAYPNVFILSWNKNTNKLDNRTLPSLPGPCTFTSAARIRTETSDAIYVAGGQSEPELGSAMKNFWVLDLTKETGDLDNFKWQEIMPWPGPARALNLTIHQHNGETDCVYIISGVSVEKDTNDKFQLLTDVYEFAPMEYDATKYDPETGCYTGKGRQGRPWRKRTDVPHCVMAGAGIGVGQSHIFVFGGDDGSRLFKASKLQQTQTDSQYHMLMYHTITDTWITTDRLPGNYVATQPVRWDDSIVVAGGAVSPEANSAKIWRFRLVTNRAMKYFSAIDFAIIVIYQAALIGVGVFFYFRQKSTEDYFRGGQRVPWFVAGCSIYATMLSSLTFIAIPAKVYATDWVFFFFNMVIFALAPFIIAFVLPFFRNIDATSAYEYLEKRFNITARLFASVSFILLQIGRMSIVMFLTALPLAAITPMSVVQCILIMGVMTIIYCTIGGLEAVVWTDTIQTFVLLGGAMVSLVIIVTSLNGGLSKFFAIAAANEKFHIVNWDWDLMSFATPAIWVVILGSIGQNLVSYSSDMGVVQRYMSVPDEKRAAKAIWTNAIAAVPTTVIFFGVGTALYVFYKTYPAKIDPTSINDAIFPLFIARELTGGVGGLVVAGILAAAQSTLSTNINSASTSFVTDFVRRFNLIHSEQGYLNLARAMTFILGSLGTGIAVLFAYADIKSMWEAFMGVLGLLGGAMCGLFLLGMFTRRTNGIGAIIGAAAGTLGLFSIQRYTPMHNLLYAFVGISICFVVGYVASLIISVKPKRIDGLTIYTLERFKS